MLSKLLSFSKIYDWFQQIGARQGALDFFFEHKPGIKVLDVGCGSGNHTHYFCDANYLGIDLSTDYIYAANSKYKEFENISFLLIDVNNFVKSAENQAEKYDLIIL